MTAMAEKSRDSLRSKITKTVIRVGVGTAFALGVRGDAHAPQVDHPDIDPIGTTHVLKKPINLRGWRNSLPGVTTAEEESQTQRQRTRTEAVANQHVANLPQAARPDTLQMTYEDQEKGKTFATVVNIVAGIFGTAAAVMFIDMVRRNPKKAVIGLTAALAACGPQIATAINPTEGAPTAITQQTIAPETATPFVNENITATPNPTENAAPQTNEYPTSFGGGEAAGMYTYEGQAGRDAMTPVLRGYNDRYIPEMKRAGFITGETPAEQYTSFDNSGYEMRYFESKTGQWVLMPYHPSHGYFVPTNVDGLAYVDLKLPYGEVFAPDGSPVNQGNDNFNFKTFQADGVQFINGWPILIRTDGEGLASTALDMKKGGAETPIVLASATEAAPSFSLDSAGLEADQLAAMKAHYGLEGSITAVEGGTFTATVMVMGAEGMPVEQTLIVAPATLNEDLATKNILGKTPIMFSADGQTKLYWIQEEGKWFARPVESPLSFRLPIGQVETAQRIFIQEFSQPFAQEAIDRWKSQPGIQMLFQYITVNANTGEGTKFASLLNSSLLTDGITPGNSPVQVLNNARVVFVSGDGTEYTATPSKWLDPTDAKNPKGDEWKMILTATGPEIMNDEASRALYDQRLNDVATRPSSRMVLFPIFKIENGFFTNGYGSLVTFGTPQPSLEKLYSIQGNNMENLPNPGFNNTPYSITFNAHFPNLSATNAQFFVGIGRDDPNYHGFFPQDIQNIIFPSLIIQN